MTTSPCTKVGTWKQTLQLKTLSDFPFGFLKVRVRLEVNVYLAIWVFGKKFSWLASAKGFRVQGSNLELWQPAKSTMT